MKSYHFVQPSPHKVKSVLQFIAFFSIYRPGIDEDGNLTSPPRAEGEIVGSNVADFPIGTKLIFRQIPTALGNSTNHGFIHYSALSPEHLQSIAEREFENVVKPIPVAT